MRAWHLLGFALKIGLLRYSAGEPLAQMAAPARRVGEWYMKEHAAALAYADLLPLWQGDRRRTPIWKVREKLHEPSLTLAMLLATGAEFGFLQQFVRCAGQAGE